MIYHHVPTSSKPVVLLACASLLIICAKLAVAEEPQKPGKAPTIEITGEFDGDTFPAGIVYGPKAAFKIRAPEGWVVDNQAGASQGLPCVLYPKDSTWADADAVMYARIASTDTVDRDAFVKVAMQHMRKDNEHFTHERVAEGKTRDGHAYLINDYRHGARENAANSQFERVAYIQLPKAVAYIVFTVPSEELHKKHAAVVEATVKSFTYEPEFINFGSAKKEKKKKKNAK